MSNSKILLDKYYLFDCYGIGKNSLSGEYNPERLAKTMIDAWVPYGECHRNCTKSDYCKYVIWIDKEEHISKEILCGVATNAITNFVDKTFDAFCDADNSQKQNYLDGAFHFYRFVFRSEMMIGNFINRYFLDSWDNYAITSYGHVKYLRDHINMMTSLLKNIPEFNIKKGILFVEGESEERFLNKLKESHLIWFLDLEIFNYRGKSNKRPNRIEMLIDDYIAKGYEIFIQGDADGKPKNTFQVLIDKNKIKENNSFVFDFDFESSIPASLLLVSLKELQLIKNVDVINFNSVIKSNINNSIEKTLKENYNIDICPHKTILAETIANNINNTYDCWQNEWFLNTELGKFLKFIQDIN